MPTTKSSNQIQGDETKKDEIIKANHKNIIDFAFVFLVTPDFES